MSDQTENLPASISSGDFEKLLTEMRPDLHRYCARMTGSVPDGEDVLQETYTRAYELVSKQDQISNLRGWLYRIAHNKAIDYLRASKIRQTEELDDELLATEPDQPLEDKELTEMTMSVFLKLPPMQRGAVILKDVLDYSLKEISGFLDINISSVQGALHRGRSNLRAFATGSKEEPQPLQKREMQLLEKYVARFSARDFDALREMLAEDVRLDLVGREQLVGEKVGIYFGNYNKLRDWQLTLGKVERRPAILVYDPENLEGPPIYCIFIQWNSSDEVTKIYDFRYARYVMQDAEVSTIL